MRVNTSAALSLSTWLEVNMPVYKPIIPGERFGKWIVLASHSGDEKKCECRCDCGVIRLILPGTLRADRSHSCGCSKPKHSVKHTRAFAAWRNMIYRCSNPNNKFWKDYGGRGITVCESWLNSFEVFLEDMGDPPIGLTLDRLDNDAGYSKGNCAWRTPKEQTNNRRVSKRNTQHVPS